MSNKYFILKLLQLTIVAGVCCMALQVFLIVILDWSEITNLQLTSLTMGREWLRKLHGAAVQSNNKPLTDAITQILNATNPTDYNKLNQLVMEAIVKNNT